MMSQKLSYILISDKIMMKSLWCYYDSVFYLDSLLDIVAEREKKVYRRSSTKNLYENVMTVNRDERASFHCSDRSITRTYLSIPTFYARWHSRADRGFKRLHFPPFHAAWI